MNKTLILIFLNLFITVFTAPAQDSINWELPFKKCGEIKFENTDAKLIASDNQRTIYVSKEKGKISSIDVETGEENWRADIGGILLPQARVDSENLYLVSRIDNNSETEKNYLRAINIRNGITNWKAEIFKGSYLSDYENFQSLILLNKNGSITNFNKKNGSVNWAKKDELSNAKFYAFDQDRIYLQTSKNITGIITSSGDVSGRIDFDKTSTSVYLQDSQTLISGDALGNLSLKNFTAGKILWQTKVGGYISFIDNTSKGFLVSSYDNFLYLFSKKNGRLIWKKRVNGRITDRPLITSGYVITNSNGDNYTNIIDLKNGKSINQIVVNKEDNFINSPVLMNNYLLLQTLNEILFYSNKCLR